MKIIRTIWRKYERFVAGMDPKIKKTVGWLTDDRKLERIGRRELSESGAWAIRGMARGHK